MVVKGELPIVVKANKTTKEQLWITAKVVSVHSGKIMKGSKLMNYNFVNIFILNFKILNMSIIPSTPNVSINYLLYL